MGAAKIFACDYQSLTKITPTLGASLNCLKSVVSRSGAFTPLGDLLYHLDDQVNSAFEMWI